MYQTGARVGSTRNNVGVGIVSLQKQHVKIKNGVAYLNYFQKKNTHAYILNPNDTKNPQDKAALKSVIRHIDETFVEKDPPTKRLFDISYETVKRKIKQIFKHKSMTSHKMRHLKSYTIMKPLLDNTMKELNTQRSSMSKREFASKVHSELNKAAKEVGEQLKHFISKDADDDGNPIVKVTGATVLKAYTLPSLIVNYYKRLRVPLPQKYMEMYKLDERNIA